MNIVTHTQALVTKADEETSAREAALNQTNTAIAAIEKKFKELATTRDRLMAEGMNKSEVELKMQEVEAKRVALVANQSGQKSTVEEAKVARKNLEVWTSLAQLCEEKLRQVEIPELGRIRDFQTQISAELRFEKNVAKSCRLWIGESHRPIREFELPVKSAIERIRRGVVPAALEWVPQEWLPARPSSSARHVGDSSVVLIAAKGDVLSELYFVWETETVVPLRPEVHWTEIETRPRYANQWNSPLDEVSVLKKVKWGGSEAALTEQLAKIFEKWIVDLDSETKDPFLGALVEKVREATQPVDQVIYSKNTSVLKTGEIEKRIGASFRKFVDAPWTAKTKGLLANLKYYCEQGERPRFNSCEVEGAYGFRLRTRDHNWIRGRVYVVPDALPYESESNDIPEINNNYGSSAMVRQGRLILSVEGESRD